MILKQFQTFEELKIYNEENHIRHHNLHFECTMNDILKGGIIVCLEGDDDLEDYELSEALNTYNDTFLMLNEIYKNPQKLMQLKLQHVNGNCIQHREINVSSKLQNLELLSKDQICCVYEQLSNAKYFNLEQSNDLRYDDYILVIGDYWRDLIFKDYIYTQKEFEYLKKLYSWKENTLKEHLRFNY